MFINTTTAVGALGRHPSGSSTFLSHAVFPAKPLGHKRVDRRSMRVDAGNANSSGLFAPLVIVTRDIVGKKQFNKFRGKAIQLHSQVSSRPDTVAQETVHTSFASFDYSRRIRSL